LCRRSGRNEEAERQLKELIDLPRAAAWRMEIADELKLTRSASEEEQTLLSRAA
jgi:hypothetical protein